MKPTNPIRRGWVLYDGEWRLCTGTVARFGPVLRRLHFELAPLQTPWVRERLGLKAGEMPDEMKLLAEDGRIYGGAEALLQMARLIWWARPLYALAQIPGGTVLFRAIYRQIAASRHCLNGACEIPKQSQISDWMPLFLLPALVVCTRDFMPAWIFMWLLASAIFSCCKWLTWRQALRQAHGVNGFISLGYLFAWVGMDARIFLRGKRDIVTPKPRDWLAAIGRFFFGVILIWFVARRFLGT